MSSMTVSVPVIPAATMAPFAAAAGAGIAGLGLAAAAYFAARKLTADYQCALNEFQERAKAAASQRDAWRATDQQHMAKAASLADLVAAKSSQSAASTFLAASLNEALKLSDRPDMAEFHAKAQDLLKRLNSGVNVEELGEDAIRIGNEIHKRLGKTAEQAAPALLELFGSVQAEIEAIQNEEKRSLLLGQLERLQALPTSEGAVAIQGLANVRDQATRLMQFETKRESDRARRREIAAESVAMLQAIAQVPDAAESAEAMKLLAEIGAAFSSDQPPTIDALEGFMAKAKVLFDACQARLDNTATAAMITDSVADTLMEMGYKVSHVPAEGSDGCLVSVDEDTGMLVSVDKAGQLKTEMVAFASHAVHPGKAMQDKVCHLVDEVLEGLRKRDIEVREKSRKTTKSHEQIRMMKKPQDAKVQLEMSKPKERAVT